MIEIVGALCIGVGLSLVCIALLSRLDSRRQRPAGRATEPLQTPEPEEQETRAQPSSDDLLSTPPARLAHHYPRGFFGSSPAVDPERLRNQLRQRGSGRVHIPTLRRGEVLPKDPA